MQLCGSLSILWHCIFWGLEWKLTFQACGHCWVFQICWHTECNTFTASSFRFWNSSTGIPSPPLALFVVMLPKAHLTSHSRMSRSRWVITPSWLSGLWRYFFVQFFCVFLPPLLNIFHLCECWPNSNCSTQVSHSPWNLVGGWLAGLSPKNGHQVKYYKNVYFLAIIESASFLSNNRQIDRYRKWVLVKVFNIISH